MPGLHLQSYLRSQDGTNPVAIIFEDVSNLFITISTRDKVVGCG